MVALIEALSPEQRYQRRVAAVLADLHRTEAATARDVLGILADIRRELLKDLADVAVTDGAWPAYRRQQLLAAVNEAAAGIVQRVGPALNAGTVVAWELGVDATPSALRAAGISLHLTGISRDALTVVTQLQADLVKAVSDDFRRRAAREVVLASAGARSPWQAQQAVRGLLAMEPARAAPRFGPVAAQAERIVRTELMSVFNLADQGRDAEIAADQPALRKWWDAANDRRTRETHRTAERRYQPGGSEGPIKLTADFTVGGYKAKGPHDPRLPAREVIKCRCTRAMWHLAWTE